MNRDRPTVKMIQMAAAIRRDHRDGRSMAELAIGYRLPVEVVAQVVATRTIDGASVVLFHNALQSVKIDDKKYMIGKG